MKSLLDCRPGALAFGACILLTACAGTPPPVGQMATSKAAVADADGAGGMQFAPVEMKAARDKLDRAGVAMTAKDHDLARTLAEASQVDAQLAEAKAHASKARAAADAVSADGRVLRNELDRRTK